MWPRLLDRIIGPCRSCLRRGFDYRTLYRRADLDRNYWSIVGPGSREEFEALGKGKRQQLIDLGLTPRSRVLDVGCGTGQLTEALADFLEPEGLYYGTDIAEEAVAFCQKRFLRPNFFFAQSAMTRIPIEGIRFEMIYFCSVFTHMYPEEIRALLGDVPRLLAPEGKVIADVFISSRGHPFAGHRGMVEIHETYVPELFAGTGLSVQLVRKWTWQQKVERAIFQFTHPAPLVTESVAGRV